MSAVFDPYHRWLGIAPDEQPPHHYRLLGLKVFEGDADVIESAADRQMSHVRGFQAGKHADDAERILNEISAARLTLLQADKKAAYDAELRTLLAPQKQQRAAEQHLPTARPLEVALPPAPVIMAVAAPLDAPHQVVMTRGVRSNRRANPTAIVAAIGGVLALLVVAGAVLAVVRPWEAATDDESPPLIVSSGGANVELSVDNPIESTPLVLPPPVVPPVLPPTPPAGDKPPTEQPPPRPEVPEVVPNKNPPKETPPSTDEFRIPIARYSAGKSVLIICNDSERDTAMKACGAYGLKGEPGGLDAARADYTAHHTIITGSNAMDYWAGNNAKHEAFAAIEKFVADGGHLIVSGGYNGRNMHHMQRFGIRTGFQHGNGFQAVPEHTEVFLRNLEGVVPKDNHLKSAGHFWVTRPHIVLLQRTDRWGPALVTLPWERGRVTFTQVEPHWQGDLWLITALIAWVSRGAPTRADDADFSPTLVGGLPAGIDFRPPETKLAVPSKDERDTARKEIDGIFPENASASRAEKLAACERMLKLATDPKMVAAERFELLNRARQSAADAGQVRLALAAIDMLAAQYDFDFASLRGSTVVAALKAPVPATEKRDAIVAGLELLDAMIARDEYADAVKLVSPLLDVARRIRDRELIATIAERRKQAEDLLAARTRVAADFEKLRTDPNDPAANLAVGKFYLSARRDWKRALECLAKGGDAQLAAAAKGELARPTDVAAKRALGDVWWQLAEAETDDEAERVYRGLAALWYREVASDLKGIEAATVRRRGEEVAAADLAAALGITLAHAETREVQFLDDIPEVDALVPFPIDKHNPGRTTIVGQKPEHALGVHAQSKGEAFVRYNLDGSYDLCRGIAGLWIAREPPPNPNAESPLVFSIEADGKVIWKSRPIQKHGDGQPFEVMIRGVRVLKLRVDCAGGSAQAWSTWADPQIMRSKLK